MTRREDWPRQLDAAIAAARGRPFEWGVHDCATFAADVVLAITGADPMGMHRSAYRSHLGAFRVTRRFGGLFNLASRALGDPIRVGEAMRGDVVAYCDEAGASLGICIGERGAFAGPSGLSYRRLEDCVQAWRV